MPDPTQHSNRGNTQPGEYSSSLNAPAAPGDLSLLSQKLQTLRSELHSSIRDLERRLTDATEPIPVLFEQSQELRLYVAKKADQEDTKKQLLYIERKLREVYEVLKDEEKDAVIAKKNWFCLSCDRVLEGYSGKVAEFVPWDRAGVAERARHDRSIGERVRPGDSSVGSVLRINSLANMSVGKCERKLLPSIRKGSE